MDVCAEIPRLPTHAPEYMAAVRKLLGSAGGDEGVTWGFVQADMENLLNNKDPSMKRVSPQMKLIDAVN